MTSGEGGARETRTHVAQPGRCTNTVTGSKHLLEADGKRILLDCGLFQGVKNLQELNWTPLPVDPATIDAVIVKPCPPRPHRLSAAVGARRLPRAHRVTEATASVADIILRDSAYHQNVTPRSSNKRKATKRSPHCRCTTARTPSEPSTCSPPRPFGKEFTLPDGGPVVTFRRGHILGAATVDLVWHGRRIVFSGDLGRYDDPVMLDPEPVPAADYLLIESTYGDRLHERTDPADALAGVIDATVDRRGTVVIPAFAVGRAQTLLYYLYLLRSAGRLPEIPVYLDSPMAINASKLLGSHPPTIGCRRRSTRKCAPWPRTRRTPKNQVISANREPKIVISASGMATGGRVLHHLRHSRPIRATRSC